MEKRKLQNLNLLDNFLFGTMVSYPGIGEAFIRELLNIILNRKFGKLKIVPQKVYYGADTDKHGTRLDVYLEGTEEGEEDFAKATVYDMEPDQTDDKQAIAALPQRTRFYHAKIDALNLKSGEDYSTLKKVVVILITPYDPFGRKRMIYTIRNKCVELPDMPYDDGAWTLFLYTKGTEGNSPEELRQLLRYMEDTNEENASNEALKNIQKMVDTVKRDGEVSLEYMKIYEREAMLIRQGRREEQENTERERQRADAAETRANDAEARADEAEAEVRRLQEELQRWKKTPISAGEQAMKH